MGIVVRQSSKSVFLTYLGIGIGVINTLWLLPYILTEEQLGLYRAIISAASLFAIFSSLGSANIPSRFFFYFKDYKNRHNGIFFFMILTGAVGFILFTLVFLLFRPLFISAFIKNAPLILNYYSLLIVFTFILLFITTFESYNVIQQNPVVPTFTRELLTRLLLSVSLLSYWYFHFNYYYFIELTVVSYGIVLLVLIFYTQSRKYLFLKPDFRIFKSPMIKEILVFAGFISMGNASGVIITNIDSLMLSAYSGFRNTGIYTIAFFIAAFISVPKKALSQVLVPLVSEANRNNDVEKLNVLYKKSAVTQLIIGGLLFLLIWINIDNIFKLIPHGWIYSQGKWVVLIIGIGNIFDMTTGINMEIIGTSKYYRIDLFFYPIISLMTIGLNMFLIPIYGMTGAAITAAFTVILFNTIRFYYIYLKFRIQPFSINTFKVFLIFACVIVMNVWIPQYQNHFLTDIFLRSGLIFIVFMSLNLLIKTSEDINITFYKIMARLHLKKTIE